MHTWDSFGEIAAGDMIRRGLSFKWERQPQNKTAYSGCFIDCAEVFAFCTVFSASGNNLSFKLLKTRELITFCSSKSEPMLIFPFYLEL